MAKKAKVKVAKVTQNAIDQIQTDSQAYEENLTPVQQAAVKEFAFNEVTDPHPTQVKPEKVKKVKVKPGQIYSHPIFGLVRIQRGTKSIDGSNQHLVEAELTDGSKVGVQVALLQMVGKADVELFRVQQKAIQKTKKEAEKNQIKVGDKVAFKETPEILIGTVSEAFQSHDQEEITFVVTSATDDGRPVFSESHLVKWQKPEKMKFEDINILAAFRWKKLTYVKVSKSNAIACVVRGSKDEPFAMLCTETTKISSTSIQRFRKSDRVVPYAG